MKIKYIVLLLLVNTFVINAQTNLTIEGKVYTNSDDTWLGVNILRDVPTKFIFKNNSITSTNRYGYLLQAGDESLKPTNNNLDGAIITGNKFSWSGTDMKVIPHGLFTGHNSNVVAKYNYLNYIPMGIIRKSTTNMSNTGGGVAYNIVKSGAVGIVVKGMSNVNIFNNTLYSDRTTTDTWRPLVHIYTNTDAGGYSVAHGTKIYNNIFYTKFQTFAISIDDTESLEGLECDYNVYWCESGAPRFYINGSVRSFAQWQAMGYDQHSVVVNPGFKDLVSFVPAKRLDHGKDLGSEWINGLSTSAKWGTTDPATSAQNGIWQVGAVVYAGLTTPVVQVPSYSGSVISSNSPSAVEMTYNLPLANIVPAASSFSVKVNTVSRTVIQVVVSGSKVLLTLASPVVHGDAVTVAYTKPAANPLQTTSGGQAATLGAQTVTNPINAEAPAYISSGIENSTPARIEMTYSLDLASIIPAGSAFIAKVNGTAKTVNSVSVSGKKVILVLASPVSYGDAVTISYAKPASNPLQSATGGTAETFTDKPVTNKVLNVPFKPVDTTNLSDVNKKILLYPNPARGYIKIENLAPSPEPRIVRIFSFTGKLCREIRLDAGDKKQIPLDLSSGMYFVQIEIGSVIKHVQKLIIVE